MHCRQLLAFSLLCLAPAAARADVLKLANGGEVRGQIVNKDESPRVNYQVKTARGPQVTLASDQVTGVVVQSASEMKYDRLAVTAQDTIESQWELAEFCRENHLPALRKKHLEQILKLDTDHAEARHGLGYTRVKNQWKTQQEGMNAEGRVKYRGKWLMSQEIELMEQARKDELATKDWIKKVKRWRGWLDSGKEVAARVNFDSITDPYAAKALAAHLKAEHHREYKMIYVDALGRLGRLHRGVGLDALVSTSLTDEDEEVRIACMERLYEARFKPAVSAYIAALRSKENSVVNQGAVGLRYMKDPAAIPALVEALITKHKYTIQPGGQPGQMSSTFGSGGSGGGGPGGFSFGTPKPEIVNRQHENQEVLRTLAGLAGVNFDFNVPAWKYWLQNQKTPVALDARRD